MITGPPTHHRKCVRVTGWDSPNVKLALWEIGRGRQPSGTTVVPGVLSWDGLQAKLARYSKQQVVESIDAEWYEGAEERLVTDEWLDFAEAFAASLPPRRAGRKWLGCDPGEGGDDSAWCVGDAQGVLELASLKTPDTNAVFGRTVMLGRRWGVDWPDVIFDYGGGGKQHVDRMRAHGMSVRGVRFGAIKREVKRASTLFRERLEVEEDTASYSDRRSEMAWGVRMLLERPAPISDHLDGVVPDLVLKAIGGSAKRFDEKPGFGLPREMCRELRRQIAAVPLMWDAQGRFKLIPKNPPPGQEDSGRAKVTSFRERVGRSPDQFDAFCLMVWGMTNEPVRATAGSA